MASRAKKKSAIDKSEQSRRLVELFEVLSNQKGVTQTVVQEAVEAGMAAATVKHHGEDMGVRVALDPKTGETQTFRYWEVVADDEVIENPALQLTVTEAKERDESLDVGSVIEEPLESVEFGRIDAQMFRQIVTQKIRAAEREEEVKRYQHEIGQLVNGEVVRIDRHKRLVILNLGGSEAAIPMNELLPRDSFRNGDRVRGYIYDVHYEPRGPQIFVSRTRPEMLMELFKIEVPEVGEQVIEIKSAAREPGIRAKIAVKTNDGRIDPIGACVRMRGARVQAVSGELGGERIDIVLWDENPAQFVINAMAPAEVASILMDEERRSMDIIVEEMYLSQAIGRNGQNVRLASQLTDWIINVMTKDQAAEKGQVKSEILQKLFAEQLEVESDVAAALVQEGFHSLEEVAYVALEEISTLEGFDEEMAQELQSRAKDALIKQALTGEAQSTEGEPHKDLLGLEGMSQRLAFLLASKGVCSMEDLAELSVDDLVDMVEINNEQAAQLIMKAREPWFSE